VIEKNSRLWRNWGRSQQARPQFVARPTSVEQVVEVLAFARERGLRVKAIGAGHSFTGIAATDDIQLDIAGLDGVYAVDGTRVTLGAGTNLFQLPALLDPLGLALTNMGDIDRQTLAGATSTGTHGTGALFGGLATQIVAVTLVTAAGELLHVSETENAELLPAVRLGLGALGVLVELTIECVPSFKLQAVEKPEPLGEVLDTWLERTAAVDHFEFYWFPHTDTALTKTNTRLPVEAPSNLQNPIGRWVDDQLMSNHVFTLTCAIGTAMPGMIKPINHLADRLVAERTFTDLSHQVFVAPRTIRFTEMEYALPVEHVPAALRAINELIEAKGWRISFPVEVRVAAADDNWLSTAYGRQSGYIAVHRYWREDPTEYFEGVESIMKSFDGRPHWGKMHFRDAASLATTYPRFGEFTAVRDRLDPDRLFANAYLERVLGS
jgi:L-gulono-1,4-lactone dehydrogenase